MNFKKMVGPNLTGMFKTGMILLNELIIRLMREVLLHTLLWPSPADGPNLFLS